MGYVYQSIFAEEFSQYIALLLEADRYVLKVQSTLRSLDRCLIEHSVTQKLIPEDIVVLWLAEMNVKPTTKFKKLSDARGLAKYLRSLGYTVSLPEPPIVPNDYVPYIFNEEELNNIFTSADNFMANSNMNSSAFQFPIVLRVLYGCGLRLRETLMLEWKNLDVDAGIICILEAKSNKQRRIPISQSLKALLIQYRSLATDFGICNRYVFENRNNRDEPYTNQTFWYWFSKILAAAGVKYVRKSPHERGPCAHCFRHLFTVQSFLKLESEGKSFDEAVPFVSEYLGHHGLMETEKYLRADYSLYTESHQRVAEYIGDVFPEVFFE